MCMEAEGRYLYCVIPRMDSYEWAGCGIEDMPVFALSYGDIGILVHRCAARPYSGDGDRAKYWVLAHNAVIERALEVCQTVVPIGFDVIVKADEKGTADENVVGWLRENYDHLRVKLEELRGCCEFGVQIFWLPQKILERMKSEDGRIQRLQKEMQGKPDGVLYFYRERLEKAIREELEKTARERYERYIARISPIAKDISIGRLKKTEPPWQMIMNLSLLVVRTRVPELGEELEKIDREEGIQVRFTGPWPPYSFASFKARDSASQG